MTIHSDELDAELLDSKGEVSYIAAFPGTFAVHTEEEARAVIEKFRDIGRSLAVYRIEVVEVFPIPEVPRA